MHRYVILLLICLGVAIGVGYYWKQQQQVRWQKQQFDVVMAEKIEQLYEQAQDWKTHLKFNVHDPRLHGDYKVLSEFVLQYWVNNIEARNQYLRELDQAGWQDLLDIRRLEKDKQQQYQETEQMLAEVKQIRQQYQQHSTVQFQQSLVALDQLQLKAHLRRSLKAKMIYSREQNNEFALFQLELKLLQQAERMIEYLKQHNWQRRNQLFLFKTDAEVQQFNQMYRDLIAIQNQIGQQQQQHAAVFEVEFDDE